MNELEQMSSFLQQVIKGERRLDLPHILFIIKALEELQERRQCRHPDEIKSRIKLMEHYYESDDGLTGEYHSLKWVLSPDKEKKQ